MRSKVHFISAAESDGPESVADRLASLIEKSGVLSVISKGDFTAIKTHFGDVGNVGHIKSRWIREAVNQVRRKTQNVFVADANVIYKIGSRANSIEHLTIADEHGFNIREIGAPVIIADGLRGTNFTEVAVDGRHFRAVKIASDFAMSNSMLVMSHMTGHIVTGMGCAIKNLGMGCAARRGKYEQHCGSAPDVKADDCIGCGACVNVCPSSSLKLVDGVISFEREGCAGCGECAVLCPTKAIEIRWSETLENVQQKMVEYAHGMVKALNRKVSYINFLIKITKDCDCLAKDQPAIVKDIGILASVDPVAIDKASVDLVLKASGRDVFRVGYPETDWSCQLDYAEKVGLGVQDYDLETVQI